MLAVTAFVFKLKLAFYLFFIFFFLGIDIHGTYGEVASFSSNPYNLHVTMHGETLVYLKPDSTQLNLATVTTEQAVNTLSDMLVLFQIRGLVDVKIGTKKGTA